MTSVAWLAPSADFFIHPDFHRLSLKAITAEVEDYEAALHARIGASALPILIYNPDPAVQTGAFWDQFPAEQRFRTVQCSGVLDLRKGAQESAGLNNLLDEHQIVKAVLHGSYAQKCVRAFKSKLWSRATDGVLYYRSVYNLGSVGDIATPDTVSVGVVLDTPLPVRS